MKILISCLVLLSLSAWSQDFTKLSEKLYEKPAERDFVNTFLTIVSNHKNGLDPLLKGKGPRVASFHIDEMKFAFVKERSAGYVDLLIFNWDTEIFEGLELDQELSLLYGKNVYLLKNIKAKSISSQGANREHLTNFSYVLGANSMAGNGATLELLEWKPHAEYMARNHPLRKALNAESLVLLSPDEDLLLNQAGDSRNAFKEYLDATGGFKKIMLGTMVHEMYHVKSRIDTALLKITNQEIEPDRKLLVTQLDDKKLINLLSAYTGIIFKIGSELKIEKSVKNELQELSLIITTLKKEFPNAWNFIWAYEYTEGFAEYSGVQSLVDANVVTLDDALNSLIADLNNNIAYRTGAIGGLYLRNKLMNLPFSAQEDLKKSVWEIIIDLESIEQAHDVDSVVQKHKLPEDEFAQEITEIKDYLISTILN